MAIASEPLDIRASDGQSKIAAMVFPLHLFLIIPSHKIIGCLDTGKCCDKFHDRYTNRRVGSLQCPAETIFDFSLTLPHRPGRHIDLLRLART
jgi:hypothetical protein